jgi:hypothetical protein
MGSAYSKLFGKKIKPICVGRDFEVRNGLIGMNRNVVIRIADIKTFNNLKLMNVSSILFFLYFMLLDHWNRC